MSRDIHEASYNVTSTEQSEAPQVKTQSRIPNSKLDSFEAVMKAMDLELARARAERHLGQNKSPKWRSEMSDAKGRIKLTKTVHLLY